MMDAEKEGAWSARLENVLEYIRYAAAYRKGMRVCEVMQLNDGGYYLCPRCGISLDRGFQAFCDRCGQCLDWSDYKRARRIYPTAKHDKR